MLEKRMVQTKFRDCISITEEVNELVAESGVMEGYCVISLSEPETALGITSFWDKRGLDDLMDEIERNIPARVNYKNQTSPFNASGQVKGAVIGRSEMLLIHSGKLVLGSSQGVVIMEFDGPGNRIYSVCIKEMLVNFTKHQVNTRYMGMHDITAEINKAVKESAITSGICHISQLHSTAGLLLSVGDRVVLDDIMSDIEHMVPTRADFKHRETASDAGGHVKTAITGSQISLVVDKGALVIAKGQAVVFAEYDGPRPRNYIVGVIKN